MGKLSEVFKSTFDKWNGISRGTKIAFIAGITAIIVIIVYLSVTLGATKYSVLFSNLDSNDAKTVMDKLNEKKITDVKISGNTISVPSNQVDQLRLELASQITSGSKGWELFDGGTNFASTDADMKIKYQRALQGELEKTIKSFPQVQNAKVALVLPEDSVFVKDSTPASASITLIMKPGQVLKDDQVKAIVALVTGSVKNLPKENVQVIDDNMKLLSQGIFDKDKNDISGSTDKQQQLKKDYEKLLESKAMEQLSRPYKNKVTVKVNADLDFDATQTVTNAIDPKGAVVSEKYIRDTQGATPTARPSQSPVDNNMSNATTGQNTTTTTNGNVTHEEETKNYENSKTETKTVKAPGSVKRITASVIIDGNLDDAQKQDITALVSGAIGINDKRGDSVTVAGIKFDETDTQAAKKAVDELKQAEAKAEKTKLYVELATGGGAVALLILLFALARKGKKRSTQEEQLEAIISPKGMDILIGDKTPKVEYAPIDFDMEDRSEKGHIEKEIKKYASDKPDQVADIIKSWLAEDER